MQPFSAIQFEHVSQIHNTHVAALDTLAMQIDVPDEIMEYKTWEEPYDLARKN